MDYVIDNLTVSVDKKEDTGNAALLAYDTAFAAMKNGKKEENEDA